MNKSPDIGRSHRNIHELLKKKIQFKFPPIFLHFERNWIFKVCYFVKVFEAKLVASGNGRLGQHLLPMATVFPLSSLGQLIGGHASTQAGYRYPGRWWVHTRHAHASIVIHQSISVDLSAIGKRSAIDNP